MSPTLVVLAVLAVFLGFRYLPRRTSIKARPVFRENDLFAGRLTEGLLHALISDRGAMRADTRVAGFEGTAAIVDREGACGRLVLYPALGFGRESDLPGLRITASRHEGERDTTLVVVGGGSAFSHLAFEATAPLRTLHIDDDGRLHETRKGFRSAAPRLVVENALDRMAQDLGRGTFPAIDFAAARTLVNEHLYPPPRIVSGGVVTSALTAAILLCFAIEVMITRDAIEGVGAALAVVYRMGGIHQESILAGEWQRLIAAPFLHYGVFHLLMNGWAQWSLGGPIEFLVGPWRFLARWTGSALGASLPSLAFHDTSVSAGASGAIFGLLGAFTTFVFLRKDVLPQPVPRALRNGVLATLVLNLMISFIPSIDMAAHAGGFVTGAIMALGIVRPDPHAPVLPASRAALRLAVAALVALGVGVTSLQKRADLASELPKIDPSRTAGTLRLPVPEGFKVTETRVSGLTTIDLDGSPASPYGVTYKVSELQTDDAAAAKLARSLRSGEAPTGPSEWIALSRVGVHNLHAMEILVIAPTSLRQGAERLGADLAGQIR